MDEPLKMGPPIIVSAEVYDWFIAYLDEPPKNFPKLRKLFQEESRFECGEDTADAGAS